MKKATQLACLLLLLAGAFLAGSSFQRRGLADKSHAAGSRPLYYVDPMHPAYKSETPGIAPDCGMELVPVYADSGRAELSGTTGTRAPGLVNVSAEIQQLIGVRVSRVENASGTRTLRLFGRVVPDEQRVYKLNAGIEGYIQNVSAAATGSFVKKNELLATFSAPNSLMPIQTYLLNLGAEDRFKRSAAVGSPEAQALPAAVANIQQRRQQLQNLGMPVLQMEEMKRTREVPESIKILAPADGLVLARNVSPGQKFDRGAEWYRIADLQRVWITADVSESDAQQLRPGLPARIWLRQQNRYVPTRVSNVSPQFDAGSGRVRVRLEADNPGHVLRPDMLVDVLASVTLPPMLTVPADAVLDSGVKKTVFVERGEGIFEPREVETGTSFDDRVEIRSGLSTGEKIVVAGNFLISSESRLQAVETSVSGAREQRAASSVAQASSQVVKDPACGMNVEKAKAIREGHTLTHNNQTHYFCSDSCKRKFEHQFAKEVAAPQRRQSPASQTGLGRRSPAERGRHG